MESTVLVRTTMVVLALWATAGCSEILGTRESADVEVMARGPDEDAVVVLIVRNNESDAIVLNENFCLSLIERRAGDGWSDPHAGRPCFSVFIVRRIEPSEEYAAEFDAASWDHGVYRFKVLLFDSDASEALPGGPWLSSSFRIDRP